MIKKKIQLQFMQLEFTYLNKKYCCYKPKKALRTKTYVQAEL